jgi:hypothetical protein
VSIELRLLLYEAVLLITADLAFSIEGKVIDLRALSLAA